jgi:hypothetical protein
MERCDLLAARCALSAKSVVPELILFGRRVPVDSHGAGGGRNWADPVTRHRNAGCCSERVAHFLRGLHDPLWLCREHYVFVRISRKCRRAKCEREHDTCPSDRRTAQATKPVFYSHTGIVIPFRILGKLIYRLFKTKKGHFAHFESIRPEKIFRAQPEAAPRTGALISTFGCFDTSKRSCTARRKNPSNCSHRTYRPRMNRSKPKASSQFLHRVGANDTMHGQEEQRSRALCSQPISTFLAKALKQVATLFPLGGRISSSC